MVTGDALDGEGFFPPGSVTRQIYSQTAVVLGWPRAILMQLAHPLVAAGVAQHSSYQVQPLRRFLHTFDAALQIVFGSRRQALRTAEKIDAIHQRVHGELPETVGTWAAGTPYRAGDPRLLLWVHCTLVDSDIVAYERFVRPLTTIEKERCYQERKGPAAPLGLTDKHLPGSYLEMQKYLKDEINSNRIAVGSFQRQLAQALLYPAIKHVPRKSFEPLVALTADLLPDKLRFDYGLDMTRMRKAASVVIPPLVRQALPLMPNPVKCFPLARAKGLLQAAA